MLVASGSTVSHSNSSISLAGQAKASEIGASSCGPLRRHARAAHLEDELLAQLLVLGLERLVQLLEALLAEGVVGRPVGLVEGPPGGVDGPVHLGRRRVGRPRR